MKNKKIEDIDEPYGLLTKFRKFVIPSIVLMGVFLVIITAVGSKWLTEEIYTSISSKRAEAISRALEELPSNVWNNLQTHQDPLHFFKTKDGSALLDSLRAEVKELKLSHLRVYGEEALILYASQEEKIGISDLSRGYALAYGGENNLKKKNLGDQKLYEIYVRVPNNANNIVMELYEPVDYLDQLIYQVVMPVTLLVISFLALLGLVMNRLVVHAQGDINRKSELLLSFRKRLQMLVSNEAVSTLKNSESETMTSVSKRVKATILFSDIRGFTSYCDGNDPETIVSFLNESLGVVLQSVQQYGGDVDKLIGDAVLAFFQGENAEERALHSAQLAIEKSNNKKLPRGIGVGIYTGEVVIGTIGVEGRMDFTLIGDTVNIASRLCSLAQENEIVIDVDSCKTIDSGDILQAEFVSLKGKEQSIQVVRKPF